MKPTVFGQFMEVLSLAFPHFSSPLCWRVWFISGFCLLLCRLRCKFIGLHEKLKDVQNPEVCRLQREWRKRLPLMVKVGWLGLGCADVPSMGLSGGRRVCLEGLSFTVSLPHHLLWFQLMRSVILSAVCSFPSFWVRVGLGWQPVATEL